MADTSARIARHRLDSILVEDRILLPAQDLKDDARELLHRLRDDHPKALSTGRARRIGDGQPTTTTKDPAR